MEKPKFVALLGPTGSGKSSLALELAQRFKGEIISADSVQVYRGLDIGTAKPSIEDRRLIPHHLIDILDPDQGYSAALFREQAGKIILDLHKRKIPIFVVGGTGLYLKALTRGLFRGPAGDSRLRLALHKRAEMGGNEILYRELQRLDPEAASRIHPHDKFRITRALEVYSLSKKPISLFQKEHGFQETHYEILKVGLQCERDELYGRIESRVDQMIEMGWVDEVQTLLNRGYAPGLKSMRSLGYKNIVSYLSGVLNIEQAIILTKRDTRRYAKRQITWFKADPEIIWFPANQKNLDSIERAIEVFFQTRSPR
jgi:tRNA dimethylallyltransferase